MRIIEACIYVSDVDCAEDFYSKLLGIKPYAKVEGRHVFFKLENSMLLIFNPEYTKKSVDVPPHGCFGQGHIAFAIREDEIEDLKEKLRELGIEIEAEVNWKNGGRSIYIRDPFGNSVEFTTPKIWGYHWKDFTG
jgi:Lactoylglutathione lyase and related lyases